MSIGSILSDTCKELTTLYCNQVYGIFPFSKGMLQFPDYRNGSLRVSEQEARFLFSAILERDKEFRYSVETPTKELYSFSGEGKMSAQTDVTIWDMNGTSKLFNVEFKSKNPADKGISKDIEKLVREHFPGIWFHVLENTDGGTLRALSAKFRNPLLQFDADRTEKIIFVICILSKRISFIGELPPTVKGEKEVESFFDELCSVTQGKTHSSKFWNPVC